MIVLTAIARLLVTELAVSVTTAWTPPTSLASRLWISPVRVSVKKRSGIALEVGVQRAAQVLHDVLADDVVEVRLADADQARHDREHDHQPDVEVEVRVVLADDDLVDQELEQERVDQPEEARDEDREQDDDDLEPVRPEEGDDPADRLAAALLGDRREVARGRPPRHRRAAPAPAGHPARGGCRVCRRAAKLTRGTATRRSRSRSR